MRTVTYICECGSTGGELEGAFTGCLVCNKMPRTFSIRLGKKRPTFNRCGVDAMMGENERWSWSMGVAQEDIPKAMQMYPGSEYNSEGQLKISNRSDKIRKMKQRNLVECDGYKCRKGIIAKGK